MKERESVTSWSGISAASHGDSRAYHCDRHTKSLSSDSLMMRPVEIDEKQINRLNKAGIQLYKWVASRLIYKESISIT